MPLGGGFNIVRSLPHGHVGCVLSMIKNCGLDKAIYSVNSRERNIIIALIVLRIISPGSKLDAFRMLTPQTATNSVSFELGLEDIELHEIFAAMDWLVEKQDRIESKLAKKHLENGTLVLYDLTSSYYTGHKPSLVRFGYNRDNKRGFPQIVFGLLCNKEGCPVAVEVFPGNTSDQDTLPGQINRIKNRFGLEKVIVVGDKGMITTKLIEGSLQECEGVDWISALRSSSIKALAEQGDIQLSIFDEVDLAEITSEDYPGERLIVCRNPLLAEKRTKKRVSLIEATKKDLDKVVAATKRKSKPLRGKDEIGMRVGQVANKHKMKKHFCFDIQMDGFTYTVNQESINKEKALDGIYVVRTSLKKEHTAEYAVQTYKSLSKVEYAFRTMKMSPRNVRPIYHWTDERIKSHIFICMLAYYIEWHMEQLLAPLLYKDHRKEQAAKTRKSPVEPAPRSEAARKKEREHLTKENDQVQSMASLLEFMGTICKNEIETNNNNPNFYETTQPTDLQRKVIDHIKARL